MPSKRSRQWHQRKLGDRAAARLGASGIAYDLGRTARDVTVTVTAGGQTIEFKNVQSFTYQRQEDRRRIESQPTVELRGELDSDGADALMYAMDQQRRIAEAAARLDGTYEPPPEPMKVDWTMEDWPRAQFPPSPRLDGRRRKR